MSGAVLCGRLPVYLGCSPPAPLCSSAPGVPHASMSWSRGVSPGGSPLWQVFASSVRSIQHFPLCIVSKLWSHIDLFPRKPMMVCWGSVVGFTTRWGLIVSSFTCLSGGFPSSGHSLCSTAFACQLPDFTPSRAVCGNNLLSCLY